MFRRPAGWFASLREYTHDLHIPPWRKGDGILQGVDLYDDEQHLIEWDDDAYGGAGSAARFTTLRTWGNGPEGAFVGLDLTRAREGSILADTCNADVVNLIQTIVQRNTEDAAIGESLILNDDGTATAESLNSIAKKVNDALEDGVLANKQNEGPRASAALWTPNPNDKYNIPEPIMTGVTECTLRGVVHGVDSITKVR